MKSDLFGVRVTFKCPVDSPKHRGEGTVVLSYRGASGAPRYEVALVSGELCVTDDVAVVVQR